MRKLLIIFITCTVVLLLGYVGYRGYKIYKQQKFLTLARQYMTANDNKREDNLRNAMLSLSLVLRSDPQNVEACRMMANLKDAMHDPTVLIWRSRVVELNPNSLADRIAMAQSAMAEKNFVVARSALDGVSAADKKTAAFQNTAGALAAGMGQNRVAATFFEESIRLEPQNPIPQLNLAVIRLHGTNKAEIAQGNDMLQHLAVNPSSSALRCSALRELAAEDLRINQNEAALALTRQLLVETNSTFGDKLLRLTALNEAKNPEFKTALAGYQREAQGDPVMAYELATWQVTKTPLPEVLGWVRSLPPATRTNTQMEMFEAELGSMAKDWPGMQKTLTNQSWGDADFLRWAFLSRAYAGLGLDNTSEGAWQNAVKGALATEVNLTMLLHVAVGFNLNDKAEDILWMIVKQYSANKWAPELLVKDFYTRGKTDSLQALWRQQLKTRPNDTDLKNNLSTVSMLLSPQDPAAYELAHDVWMANPTNSAYVTTYAYSLHLQNKNAPALQLFEKLKPAELENPDLAGYYGLILKANGDRVKAKKYLELSAKANLLPQEKQLFDKARVGL